MKKTIPSTLLIIFATIIAWSCEKESLIQNNSAVHTETHGDLKFVYQVTDMEGNPKAVFQEGENIMFSFAIKNQGKETERVCICYIPVDFDEFFKVYSVYNEEGREQRSEVGKPHYGAGGTANLPILEVKGKTTFGYAIPWMAEDGVDYPAPHNNTDKTGGGFGHNENDPLPKGEYYSGFTLEYNDQDLTFEVFFSVQ